MLLFDLDFYVTIGIIFCDNYTHLDYKLFKIKHIKETI